MKLPFGHCRPVVAALCVATLAAADAVALPHAHTPAGSRFAPLPVADNCYAVGEKVASQKGGKLAKAQASTQGGQAVCEIVILIPSHNGARPRRDVVVVPRG